MSSTTFSDWVSHFGEERLEEQIASSMACYQRFWKKREDEVYLRISPAWELCFGSIWHESEPKWHSRWEECGGQLFDGRMIAAVWSPIWPRLSNTFYDGMGNPYPPFARSSCAYWRNISADEAIVLGVISEAEYRERLSKHPAKPLLGKNGKPLSKEFLNELKEKLAQSAHERGGPRPGASREERYRHRQRQEEERAREAQADYEKRSKKSEEYYQRKEMFDLLQSVETTLKEVPEINDARRWEWLCQSAKELVETSHFERYPSWRARAWRICADLHKANGLLAEEAACLEKALAVNPKLAVKRRLNALKKQL